jgi:hypothetical protein
MFSYISKKDFIEKSCTAKPSGHQVNNDSANEDESEGSRNPIRIDIKHENDSTSYDK